MLTKLCRYIKYGWLLVVKHTPTLHTHTFTMILGVVCNDGINLNKNKNQCKTHGLTKLHQKLEWN